MHTLIPFVRIGGPFLQPHSVTKTLNGAAETLKG